MEAISELDNLQREIHYDEDLAIVSLVQHDLGISRKFDPADEYQRKAREYHQKLAFFCRDRPHLRLARQEYEKLNKRLLVNAVPAGAERDTEVDSPDYWPEDTL